MSGKPRVPSKARAVPVGAAMICRGYTAAACEMTRPSKVSAAAAHMSARSVAAAHGVACQLQDTLISNFFVIMPAIGFFMSAPTASPVMV